MNTLGRSSSRIVTADRRWRGRATVRRWASGLVALVMVFALLQGVAWAAPPEGVWLIDEKVAIEIFDCSGLVCGRILWLKVPRNSLGELDRDKNNPDPSLRQRGLCGLTIFWGLRSGDQDRWTGGWFYNPDDGETYRISAELNTADHLTARIYRGIPLFGETKTLLEVQHGVSEGWC